MSIDTLWQRMRFARKASKLTQDAIARECGVTRNAVSLWESKRLETRVTPSVPHLIAFCRLVAEANDVPANWVGGWILKEGAPLTVPYLRLPTP